MVFICLLNEFFDDISAGMSGRDYVVNITFPSQWFVSAFECSVEWFYLQCVGLKGKRKVAMLLPTEICTSF